MCEIRISKDSVFPDDDYGYVMRISIYYINEGRLYTQTSKYGEDSSIVYIKSISDDCIIWINSYHIVDSFDDDGEDIKYVSSEYEYGLSILVASGKSYAMTEKAYNSKYKNMSHRKLLKKYIESTLNGSISLIVKEDFQIHHSFGIAIFDNNNKAISLGEYDPVFKCLRRRGIY